MLNEFDQYLERRYLSQKARKDRWAWNHGIKIGRPIVELENRLWKPAVSYCRYADDFIVSVKGTKAHAEAIREECRTFLENELHLTLNMDKTHITHVNDGFVFLGHRIIRKRGSKGTMHVMSSVPKDKIQNFTALLAKELSGDYSDSGIDKVERLNRKLKGWANFYQFTDHTAMAYKKVDRVVFWKLAHWLGCKYRSRIKSLLRKWCKPPNPGQAKTWVLFGKTGNGSLHGVFLYRLVGSPKRRFLWRLPANNPYLRSETRNTFTSRYTDVAMAMSHC